VIVFSIQLVGLGLIIWGALVASAAGTVMEFDAMPAYGGLYLLLGASVRIFANLYRQPYALEPGLRRGYGTAMRLISAAASLSLVARIPPGSISLSSTTWLLVFAALVGLISGVYWLRAPSLIEGRRFLVAGLASLAFATTLQGNHVGSAAWGSALILAGGLASLYSVHQRRLAVLLLGAGFVLTALPFTLTASGWQRASEPPWFFWLLYLPVQALILAGYVTSIVRPAETALEGQPSWGRVIYPAGLLLLALSGLVLGFFGWDGARQPGVLPAALVATVLGGTLGWLFWRLPGLQRAVEPVVATGERLTARPAPLFGALAAGVWSLYRFLRRLAGFAAAALEGDGGLLWAVVVLVLLVSAFQVALR
jgi:hypothetical protein